MVESFITWRNVLRDFVRDCAESGLEDQGARILEASALTNFTASAPPDGADPGIGTMVAAGAYESAALSLLTSGTGFMLSRGGGGESCIVTVVLPGEKTEHTVQGKTVALAILQAHAIALLNEGE